MLRFSSKQMEEFERRSWTAFADRFRPALRLEFGEAAVSRTEPLARLAEAAIAVKLDQSVEVYRFLRVCCALEARDASPERRMLVARIAGLPDDQDRRLARMERAVFEGDDGDRWPDFMDRVEPARIPSPRHD